MGRQFLPQSQSAEKLFISRNGSRVRRWWWNCCPQDSSQNPVASLDRTGSKRRRCRRKHSTQAKQAAAMKGVRTVHAFDLVLGAYLLLHSVVLRQRLVHKSIIGMQYFPYWTIFSDDVFKERDSFV